MKKLLMLLTMAFGVLTFITFTAPNANACLRCEQDDRNLWYCGVYGTGVEMCVRTSSHCSEYFSCDDCQGGAGTHCSCGPTGCPASLKDKKTGNPRLSLCAAKGQEATLKLTADDKEDRIKSFLAMINSGQFDKPDTVVYLSAGGTVNHAILNIQWKKFSVGFEKNSKGKMQTTYDVVTKEGHKAHIVVVD